jgi:hypothetical protein
MPTPFMSALAELVKLLPQIRELCTRQGSIQEAVVTQNADPTGFRRIKVTREAQGGQSESDWIPCGRSSSFTDEPIPPIGTHCLIALVNGDPHKPFFLRTLSNATNPPDTGQLAPTQDNTAEIPGNDRKLVTGDRFKEVKGEQNEIIGDNCFLTVKGKKYHIDAEFGEILVTALAEGVGAITIEASELVHLLSMAGAGVVKAEAKTLIRFEQGSAYAQMQNGVWSFGNADGQTWTMGGGQWTWNLAGQAVEVTNCTGFTINGKEVIVVGSTDSDQDVNNTRGY